MLNPIVSVIVPTKNSSATLGECLESIKKQTYEPIELIVVDNFSSDNTPEVAQRYASKFFSKGPERSPQRNFGVTQATGEYVMIIDSDMNLSPEVIKECVDNFRNNPSISGVVIPEESFGVGFWAQCKKLERSFYIGVPYMEAARFFKRNDYLSVGGHDITMISGEDWDLSQRIEALGNLDRIDSYIFHNEGHISLWSSIRKKIYYAEKIAHYKNSSNTPGKVSQQTSIVRRYRLFFSKPTKLFRNPLLGIGMLFMKTCEFAFGGAGYIKAKLLKND